MPGVAIWMNGHSKLVEDRKTAEDISETILEQLRKADQAIDEQIDNPSRRTSDVVKATKRKEQAIKKKDKVTTDLSATRKERDEADSDRKRSRKAAAEKMLNMRRSSDAQYKDKIRKLDERDRRARLSAKEDIIASRKRRAGLGLPVVDVANERNILRMRDEKLKKTKEQRNTVDEPHHTTLRKLSEQNARNEKHFTTRYATAVRKVQALEEKLETAERDARSSILRLASAGMSTVMPNIFDYDATIRRIKRELLGEEYTQYLLEDDDAIAAAVRRESLEVDFFWRRVTGIPSTEVRQGIGSHIKYCIQSTCQSLCIPPMDLDSNSVMVLRFMDIYSPLNSKRNKDVMCFSAFIVPSPILWKNQVSQQYEVLRVLPQIVELSSGKASANSLNMAEVELLGLDVSDAHTQRKAKDSVDQARIGIKRSMAAFDTTTFVISDVYRHMVQKYKYNDRWQNYQSVFREPIDLSQMPIDLVATACLPSRATLEKILLAEESGGSTLDSLMMLVAGKKTAGVSQIMTRCGLPKTNSSLVAMATFAEIATFHVLQLGNKNTGPNLFDLQRDELVVSFLDRACASCQEVARFVLEVYGKETSNVLRPTYDDVAFSCIPGLVYLRVALRQLGMIHKSAVAMSLQRHQATAFAVALQKIASSRLEISSLPFLCLQSVTSPVPAAVSMIHAYDNRVVAQISSGALSFARVLLGTSTLERSINRRAASVARVDIVCTRPIVIKACAANPSMVAFLYTKALKNRQMVLWNRPEKRMTVDALLHRLASLRIDFDHSLRKEIAVHPDSLSGNSGIILAYKVLTDRMNRLSTKGILPDSEEPSATYIIPFGLTLAGTARDVAHTSFSDHPVWMELLSHAAGSLTSGRKKETLKLSVGVRTYGFFKGQPSNPMAVISYDNHVEVYLEQISLSHTVRSADTYTNETKSMISVAQNIQNGGDLCKLSGDMSEIYRAVMFNSE
eukprot:1352454-Prymnesium_polylepis.1